MSFSKDELIKILTKQPNIKTVLDYIIKENIGLMPELKLCVNI